MNRDDIIRMARGADLWMTSDERIAAVERFAAIVASAKQQALLAEGWRPCALGQRTTQHCALSERAVLEEREACARVCESYDHADPLGVSLECASFIRARGEG